MGIYQFVDGRFSLSQAATVIAAGGNLLVPLNLHMQAWGGDAYPKEQWVSILKQTLENPILDYFAVTSMWRNHQKMGFPEVELSGLEQVGPGFFSPPTCQCENLILKCFETIGLLNGCDVMQGHALVQNEYQSLYHHDSCCV